MALHDRSLTLCLKLFHIMKTVPQSPTRAEMMCDRRVIRSHLHLRDCKEEGHEATAVRDTHRTPSENHGYVGAVPTRCRADLPV